MKGKSHGFSRVAAGTWNIFSRYRGDGPSTLVFVQQIQDSCLVTREPSVISSILDRPIGTLLEARLETQVLFPVTTVILGFLSIFKTSQASSPYEALTSACLSTCQRDGRPPIEIRRGHRSFSRVTTRDSDIPSSCEIKENAAFKPLLGNLVFF